MAMSLEKMKSSSNPFVSSKPQGPEFPENPRVGGSCGARMHDGSRGQPVVDVIGGGSVPRIEEPRELYETTNQPMHRTNYREQQSVYSLRKPLPYHEV
jgi:hypothetical protein